MAVPNQLDPTVSADSQVETAVRIAENSARACLEWLPADSLRRLARYTTAAAVRRKKDEERDACYLRLAAGLSVMSGRELARTVAKEVGLYRDGRWRFERGGPTPAEPRRALMFRILQLDSGQVLTAASLRRVFAAAV